MKFGQLIDDTFVNSEIYSLFNDITTEDTKKFVRNFQSQDINQKYHTFRELILGAELRRNGYNAHYELKIAKKTPDWLILSAEGSPIEIIDVVTLHQRREVDDSIKASLKNKKPWSGWTTMPPEHICSKVELKANKYEDLTKQFDLPYVVAVFGDFTASIEPEVIEYILHNPESGLFSRATCLSGVIFFSERFCSYRFNYFPNPHTNKKSILFNTTT